MMLQPRLLIALLLCAVLAGGVIAPPQPIHPVDAAAARPQLGPGFVLPGSTIDEELAGKYPSIAGAGGSVHMLANTNRQAEYWTKPELADSIGEPISLGATAGDTDYSTASISAAPDGTLYAVWVAGTSSIVMRRRPLGSGWQAPQTIYTSSGPLAYADIAADDTQLFVVWSEGGLYRFTRSSNGGQSWSGAQDVSPKQPYKPIFIAAGGNHSVVAAFGSGDGHVYAALWNGAAFDTFDLTPLKEADEFFAFARPAVAPNGTIYVAFTLSTGGIYYSERQRDGSWPISRLAGGSIWGAPAFAVDADNNLHFAWSSNASGRYQLYYAYKPSGGAWQGPTKVEGIQDKVVANVDLAATLGGRAYAHTIFETFDGSSSMALRYQQFFSPRSPLEATPLLDGGAQLTRNSLVTLSFPNVQGNPDALRYSWDAPPTSANAWLPFASPLSIPAPAGLSEETCATHTLYTQLRQGAVIQSTPGHASEIFDIGVQAQLRALNPNMAGLPAGDGMASPGANDGDARYTRDLRFFLSLNGQADCAQLKELRLAGGAALPILDGLYESRLALPGGSAVGDHSFSVQVDDRLGNSRQWSPTLTYDPASTAPSGAPANAEGLPQLAPGGSFQADQGNSVMRVLSFHGISVSDNLYGRGEGLAAGRQFWGLWIANATTDVGPDSPTLRWASVQVPAPASAFSVSWSLFSGLGYSTDLANRPGNYYIYVRFLDGAGNPSRAALRAQVALRPGYSLPTRWLPLLQR